MGRKGIRDPKPGWLESKEIFSLADCCTSPADLIVVHSSLFDFAPGLARDEEFPLFPSKLGVITRFRNSRLGYIATIETEWPTLTSTTRGEIALCSEAEELTCAKTQLLIARCESLAQELVNQADRLRSSLKPSKLIHASKVSVSDYADSLDDSGKPHSWEISACDRRDTGEARRPQERREHHNPQAPQAKNMPKSSSRAVSSESRSRLDPGALSAILADDD